MSTSGPVAITVPDGATFSQVTDTLVARGLVGRPLFFRIYARVRGDDRSVRSGSYSFEVGTQWEALLDDLVVGRVQTIPMTVPEGFTLKQMAPRIAAVTGQSEDAVLARLQGDSTETTWSVPGPGLEGYLFPDTYRFAQGAPFDAVLGAMIEQYKGYWTPGRTARRTELELSEREVVTLASIVQAEARKFEEMPTIAAVYHNRLRRGWPLQADPTVLYALGGYRARLLYAAIDSVADHPYNTYARAGLPPGPIGAPGAEALDAALTPADVDYMYFVANPDGSHAFTRTLAEHNRAKARSQRAARGPGGG